MALGSLPFLIAAATLAADPLPPAPADAPKDPAAQAAPSLDFDLDVAPVQSPEEAARAARRAEEVERQVALRRTMLELHQVVGLGMLASMAATSVVGNLNLVDRYGGGGDTGRYRLLHRGLVIGTSTLFAAGGTLGFLAPVPFEKKLRLDTATIHKALMIMATAGMVTQIVLGIVTASLDGRLVQVDLVTAHQVVGYVTLGASMAGAASFLF
jgi:hypothetical protein